MSCSSWLAYLIEQQPRLSFLASRSLYALSLELTDNGFDFSVIGDNRRAGVEGTISQGVRAFGLRQARYRGVAKVHLQHILTAVAINVVRLVAWWQGVPTELTRTSRFAALAIT